MSQIDLIRELLREEYVISRHIFWRDEESGEYVNDVSYTTRLIQKTAECPREGQHDCWRDLAAYAIERSMSYPLMFAIGEYIQECADLKPLPLIDMSKGCYRNWRGGVRLLCDESDHAQVHAPTIKPEPEREIHFKRDHQWTLRQPRFRDSHPEPETETVGKSQHWLF